MADHYSSISDKINWSETGKKTLLILLLPIFFVLKGYNENFALIPPGIIAKLFFKYFFISLTVFGISLILLRKLSKATLFSIYLLCIFFFFGAGHDLLKRIFKPGFITSYTLLLPFIFLFSTLIFFLLRRSKSKWIAVLKYCNYLLVILTTLEVAIFVYKLSSNKSFNDLATKPPEIKTQSGVCVAETNPDIFFVILDGYTSSKCLRKEFDYSNEFIDSLLNSNHFFTSTDSKSNYNITPFSLASTLNMNYLKPGLEDEHNSSKIFLQSIETLKNNYAAEYFKTKGYLLKNFGCFNFTEVPTITIPYFDYLLKEQIDNQTIYSRIQKDIGWNFTTRNVFTSAFKIPKGYKVSKEYHIFRNQFNWNNLIKEIQVDSDSPRFVYAHIMLPHEPFYFNEDGSMLSDTALILNGYNVKTAYFNQLLYTNRLLAEFILMVAKRSARERIVIIQGDHGFRDYAPGSPRENDFMNLNTYYFSDHNYSMLYDSISPVNSFRVILNKYFCQSFPLLKDSSIYLKN